MDDLAQQAVNSALTGNWKEAIKLNAKILKRDKKDVEALNRLAKAYAECGEIKKAKAASKRALTIEPSNQIALRCFSQWKKLKAKNNLSIDTPLEKLFLEEPGKTKIITLIHIGSPETIATLYAGNEVVVSPHPHRVSICTTAGKYIGRLPDDFSARVRRLIKKGGRYQAYIKAVEAEKIKIFIRAKTSQQTSDQI